VNEPHIQSSYVNPFLVREGAITFSELIEKIRASTLPASRRRDILSAINRYLKETASFADTQEVRVPDVRQKLLKLEPAKLDISPKTWSNLKSNLLAGIELGHSGPVTKTTKVALTQPWEGLLRQVPDRRTREGLSRFMRFCSANNISPTQVDEEVLARFEIAVREGSFARRALTLKRDVATLWNRLVERLPEAKLTMLGLPIRRNPSRRIRLDALPSSFAEDLRAHLKWASIKDPFADNARQRPLSPRSLRLREQYVLSAITALVQSGVNPARILSLGDLTSPKAFMAILRKRLQDKNSRSSSYDEGLAKALVAIAKEWVQPGSDVLTELKRLKSRLPPLRPGLTEKNKVVLREFNDPKMMHRLQEVPQLLWSRAERRPFSFRALAEYEAALAISILTFAPLRIANLAALEFGRTLHVPARDNVVTVIDIPGAEMKAGQSYMIELPPHLTKKLRIYHARLQAEYRRQPRYVFDTGNGDSKLPASLSWLIQRTLRRELGIAMTAHQFRHVMADLLIANEPTASSFETARQLLGHRNISTTIAFYTGQNTIRAGRYHQRLVQAKLAQAKPSNGRRGNASA
jgi:integrase